VLHKRDAEPIRQRPPKLDLETRRVAFLAGEGQGVGMGAQRDSTPLTDRIE
jgi:hypothetical protein